MTKNSWLTLLGIMMLFSLALGLVLGSQIEIGFAEAFPKFEKLQVEVTAYSPSPHTTDSTPFEMASGKIAAPVNLERIEFVALSRDLLKEYDVQWGDIIWIGFEVQDKMGPKVTQGVDVFMRNMQLALKFGRQDRTIIIQRD